MNFSQKSGEATLAGLAGSKPIKQQTGIQNPYIFQEIIKNMSEIFQTYSISEICQTYFRNISDPEPNQYWGVRKRQKTIQKLNSSGFLHFRLVDFTILVFDTQFHKLTRVNRYAYKLWVFSVQCIDIEAMAKVQTICVKNVAITDTCPTIQRPRWAKWSTSTPLRSLRQLGPQDLQCSQSRKHSMPETKTLRPRGKPVSSKETRHSDITPWLNPGHRDPSGDAGDPSNCQSSPGNGTSGH